ncbi:MAG: hypothetical protein ABFD08_08030 [Syntrophomonas sp.]
MEYTQLTEGRINKGGINQPPATPRPQYAPPAQGTITGKVINTDTGLTPEEQVIMNHLVEAWVVFTKLSHQHPDEVRDFTDAIHRLQDLLAFRVCQRCFPVGWPSKGGTK